jgi:muramoyltetrapeptide carboxypeptidase
MMAGEHRLATGITRDILFGTLPQYEVRHSPYDHCGRAEGILVGGNLSSYSAITGTSFQLPPKHDVILFIEETEEPLHNIDRLFYRLRLQLDFERVRGIILGSFNSIRFDLQSDSVEQILTAHLAEYDIPVCCGFPVGGQQLHSYDGRCSLCV